MLHVPLTESSHIYAQRLLNAHWFHGQSNLLNNYICCVPVYFWFRAWHNPSIESIIKTYSNVKPFQNIASLLSLLLRKKIYLWNIVINYFVAYSLQSSFVLHFQDVVPKFLDKLTDEELKKESKNEAKNDALSSIIKALKQLVSRLPNQEETAKSLEIFRLKMILRYVS